ncbi:B12-binding domain-containing radical SAM protein [Calditerricola yamamurae]
MKVIVTTLNAKYIHTCLALRYLKSFAEPEFPVTMKEYTIKDPAMNIAMDLYKEDPDVIGFSCYIWNIEQTIPVLHILKKVKPSVKIVLGGPEVSYDLDYWFRRIPEADFIVYGEGEETFKELLAELAGGRNFQRVLGLAYRDADGTVVVNPPRPKLDLRRIPSPYRFPEDRPHLPNRIVYMETSRGCPFRCQFCLSSVENGVRYFDLDRIKEDILYLVQNGARTIKFVDRTFNIHRTYAMELFRFLIDHHGGCVFQFEITADILRPEIVEFLNAYAPPGIFRFEIGVQSTNALTNALIQRKQNFEKLSRTVRKIKEGGKIVQHLDLIAGLPEEDYASFKKTFNDVFALEPEELQLGFLKLLRGTGLRRDADKYGYVYTEHAPYEVLASRVLSFDDVISIKRVEDILEKYWNSHYLDETVKFLTRHAFETPFDFFQEFGDYWAEREWSRIGHQLEDLFLRLREFLEARGTPNLPVIEGLMKYDYLTHYRHKPRAVWWTAMGKEERQPLLRRLAEAPEAVSAEFAALQLSETELAKRCHVEVLPFDLAHYLETEGIRHEPSCLIVYYDPEKGKGKPFAAPLARLGLPLSPTAAP